MIKPLSGTEKITVDKWWLRQFKNLESYPALFSVLAAMWVYVINPAMAKDFCTREDYEKTVNKLDQVEMAYKESDQRIENKIDRISEKIDDIYQILIEMK